VQGTQGLPTGRLDRHYREGVLFVTYSTLISKGSKDGRGARVPLPSEPEPVGGYADDSDNEDHDNDDEDEFGQPGAQPRGFSSCALRLDTVRADPRLYVSGLSAGAKICISRPASGL